MTERSQLQAQHDRLMEKAKRLQMEIAGLPPENARRQQVMEELKRMSAKRAALEFQIDPRDWDIE